MTTLTERIRTQPRLLAVFRDDVAKDGFALAGYVALVVLFYAPLLLGQRTLPAGDFTEQFLLFQAFQRDELLAGRLPLWNPYNFAGHPFLADVQTAVFYPLNSLLLLLTASWSSLASRLYWLQVEVVLHILLAGFFVYLFVRDLTGQRGAAFLSGAAFAFSGYLTGYPPLQLSVLRTAIWLPLVLWCLWRGFARPFRWRWWMIAALAYAAAFLAGHSQTFFFASQVILAWVVLGYFLTKGLAGGRIGAVAYIVRATAFYLVALGLSAAQLLPSLEYVRLSSRANVGYEFLSGGFSLPETWQLVVPGTLTLYSPLYVSTIALGLALLAIVVMLRWFATAHPQLPASSSGSANPGPTREQMWVALFFTAMVLFYLLLSYGGEGFLYPILHRWVPGWQLFRGQERAAYVVAFSLCVLAGQGAALLPHLSVRTLRGVAAAFAFFILSLVSGYTYFWQAAGRTAVDNAEFARQAGGVLLWAGLFMLFLWGTQKRWTVFVLATLVLADLIWAGVAVNPEAISLAERVAFLPEAVAVQQAVQASEEAHQGLPGRVFNEWRARGNYSLEVKVEDLRGTSPLFLERYGQLLAESFPHERMWQLTGTEYVLTWAAILPPPTTLLASFPQATDTTYLHRLADSHPRARIVRTLVPANDAEVLRLLADPTFDLKNNAVMATGEGSLAQQPTGESASEGANHIVVQRHAPDRFTVQVQSEQGGFLVLSENWMPGWQAWRQGENGQREAIPVTRTNLTFLGLPVEAGTSRIEMRYWPASVQYGLLISGGTIGFLLLAGLGVRRRSLR